MSQKVYTFTVSDHDKANLELVESIKLECRQTGRTFTHVCLQALREYTQAKNQDKKAKA